MRAALAIAAKDVRQRLRDSSLPLFGFVVPFGLTLVFSLLLAPLTSDVPFTARLVLADEDGSVLSRGLATALDATASAGVVEWEEAVGTAAARDAVATGKAGAALLVPAGFGAAALAGEPASVAVVGDAASALATQLAEALARAYANRLGAATLATAALERAGVTAVPGLVLAQVAASSDPLTLTSAPTSSRQLDSATYYAAGMAVFFVFFIVQLGVTGLLEEERDGTLARLLAAPIARRSVLLGKALSSVAVGVVSMAVLAVGTTLAVGARWGDSLGAALLVLAVVLAAAGLMALVAGLARTPEAAGYVQAVAALTLGALGGAFFPVPAQDGLLGWVQALSPHHWFLQGLGDMKGAGLAGAWDELAALAVFAAVTGVAGWALLERRLTR